MILITKYTDKYQRDNSSPLSGRHDHKTKQSRTQVTETTPQCFTKHETTKILTNRTKITQQKLHKQNKNCAQQNKNFTQQNTTIQWHIKCQGPSPKFWQLVPKQNSNPKVECEDCESQRKRRSQKSKNRKVKTYFHNHLIRKSFSVLQQTKTTTLHHSQFKVFQNYGYNMMWRKCEVDKRKMISRWISWRGSPLLWVDEVPQAS